MLFKGCRPTSLITSFSPKGATSRNETMTSRPFCNLTRAWVGEAWMSSTSSTRKLFLLVRTWRFNKIGPGEDSQDGTDVPRVKRQLNVKNRSWGVVLVAVHSKERMECNTSIKTTSHFDKGQFRDFKANLTPDQINVIVLFTLTITTRVIH